MKQLMNIIYFGVGAAVGHVCPFMTSTGNCD